MSSLWDLLFSLVGRRKHANSPAISTGPAPETDFRSLAENSGDILCRIDANTMPVYVSPSVERVLGWTPAEFIAAGPAFLHPDDQRLVEATNHRLIRGEIESATVTCRMRSKDGSLIWAEVNARLMREAGGAPGDVVIVMRDISERKHVEESLRAQAMTDGLTGLANRRAFDKALDREWQRTLRSGRQMSLLMLDVDRFKNFNDLYGHQAGDECLRVIASAVRAVIRRPGDLVARYGGEEIAVILPDTDAQGALTAAEAARAGIEALGLHHAGSGESAQTVTASIGVATAFARAGARMQMPAGLLLAADGALYKAKQNGRNRVVSTVLLTGCEDGAGMPG